MYTLTKISSFMFTTSPFTHFVSQHMKSKNIISIIYTVTY